MNVNIMNKQIGIYPSGVIKFAKAERSTKHNEILHQKVIQVVSDANIAILTELIGRFVINFDQILGANGNTMLIIATIKGHTEMVEFLVNKGVDVNKTNDEGNTALHYAISANRRKIIDILIQYGANEKVTNNEGITPWMTRNL